MPIFAPSFPSPVQFSRTQKGILRQNKDIHDPANVDKMFCILLLLIIIYTLYGDKTVLLLVL